MSDFDEICDLEVKQMMKNADDAGIREVIEEVIKQVENMTCSKSIDISDISLINSSDSRSTSGRANDMKGSTGSSTGRSKHRSGSRKTRVRHRKHKWKPYHKLTGNERRKLEERISRRACRAREKMSASGLTLAPYNTTQFLMDDHNFGSPDYESILLENKNKEECNSSEDYYSSPDDEEEFIQQQFSETYDNIHDDIINGMNKTDLVRELIRLEDEIESLEQSLRDNSWSEKKSELDVEAELEKIQVFEVEIKKLTLENIMLEKQRKILESQLAKIKAQ